MTEYVPHEACGCRKEPYIGARYRRMSINVLTGEQRGWRYYTVTDVEPVRNNRVICRRAHLHGDDGTKVSPFVQEVFERYEAVDNVIPMRATE